MPPDPLGILVELDGGLVSENQVTLVLGLHLTCKQEPGSDMSFREEGLGQGKLVIHS